MAITNGYASLSDVKAALRISDAIDDSLLELSIESASREIDGYTQRSFYNAGTAVRYYYPQDSFTVLTDDIVSVSELATADDNAIFDTVWTASDYQLEPLNGIRGGIIEPYSQIRAVGDYLFPWWLREPFGEATVRVTGVFGWATVPTQIRQATILLASRHYKRYDSPLGVAGFGDLGAIRVGRTDPDVEALIHPFRRMRY